MKSKVNNLLALAGVSFLMLISSVGAQSLGNKLIITNTDTKTSATVYWGATTTTPAAFATTTSATTTCNTVLTSFHKFGDHGEDVAKLQNFLNTQNGANLNGKGFYGPKTQAEVRNLQATYGVKPTGAQYQLTTALINNLNCGIIAKKTRVVFIGTTGMMLDKTTTISVKPLSVDQKIQKTSQKVAQILAANMVKNADKVTDKMADKNSQKLSTTTSDNATSTFGSTFRSEMKNIEDNYKSYIVVFLLVLALFWFLKKTATE